MHILDLVIKAVMAGALCICAFDLNKLREQFDPVLKAKRQQ